VPLGENGIAEFAFIRHSMAAGPRYDPTWLEEKLATADNIVVLCPTHHAVIDKSPDQYPVSEILRWKRADEPLRLEFNAKNVMTLLRLLLRIADSYI
jgi:hypothetical protein